MTDTWDEATFWLREALDAVVVVGPDGRCAEANAAALCLAGRTLDEIRSLRFEELVTPSEPRGRRGGCPSEFPRVSPSRQVCRLSRADGGHIPVELEMRPLPDGRTVAVCRDIRERVATEDALRDSRGLLQLILDTVPVRVFWKDRESRYLGCNAAFARDAGLGGPREIVGQDDFAMSWQTRADQYRRDDREVMERGVAKLNYEERRTWRDGTELILRTSKIPLRDAAGTVFGVLGVYEDITERKRAEAAFRSSETTLNRAQAIAHVGHFERDYRTGIIRGSEECFRIMGLPPGDRTISLQAFFQCVHPDDRAWLEGAVQHVRDTHTPKAFEYRIIWPRGDVRNVRHQGELLFDDQGTPTGFLGTLQDITEQRRAEEALQWRVDFEQLILRLASELINLPSNRMSAGLQRALEEVRTFTGEDHAFVYTLVPGEARAVLTHESHRADMPPLRSGVRELDPLALPWSMRALLEGRIVHVPRVSELDEEAAYERAALAQEGVQSVLGVPLMQGEDLKGVLGFLAVREAREWSADNIALLRVLAELFVNAMQRQQAEEALRRSEAELSRAQAIAKLGYWKLDLERALLDCSGTLCRIIGIPPATPVQPFEVLLEMIHPDDRGRFDLGVADARRGHFIGGVEFRIRRADGVELWLFTQAEPTSLERSGGRWIEGVAQDITQLKEAESARHALEVQLQQAQKMEAVGTLAGGIAHDFNNLLTSIIGGLELGLLDLPEHSASADLVRGAQEAAERAAELTRQLLTLSRKQEPHMRPVNITDLVNRTATLLSRSIPETIEVRSVLDPLVPTIRADEGQLQQALLNLGINARDAMRDGGHLTFETGIVTVDESGARASADARPGRYVRIVVRDTGEGIAADVRDHIFEPFFTTKEQGKGTGLGLAMVYGCIRGHGGWIEVESAPGRGASFSLYLPLQEADDRPQVRERAFMPRGTETILLVDDTDAVLALGRSILERCGYTVVTAWNARDALEQYRQRPADIAAVITDYVMPRGGGDALLASLREVGCRAPVILTSGYAADATREDIAEAGFAAFIAKPFTAAGLATVVRRVLDEDGAPARRV